MERVVDGFEGADLIQLANKSLENVLASNFAGLIRDERRDWIRDPEARKSLSFGLNEFCAASRSLADLYVTNYVLNTAPSPLSDDLELDYELGKLRLFLTWQLLLREPSSEIHSLCQSTMTRLVELLDRQPDKKATIRPFLEMAHFHFLFFDYDKANAMIQKAANLADLNLELAGMLGKRTRFQKKLVAQLVLINKSDDHGTRQPSDDDVPTNCILNDDTLLEQVHIQEDSEDVERRLDGRDMTEEQLACILWMARYEFAAHNSDSLVLERCLPFVDTVIAARRCWPIQVAALLLRAEIEKKNQRMVERACSQTELICSLMAGVGDKSDEEICRRRCKWVLASGVLPCWQANVLHASILRSIGCTSEALLILEKLELWDNVIDCHKALGQLEKAETLIRRLLVERPKDSMLYVYLGDITHSEEYYEKAIEMSEDRNARARRSLGHLLLMQKKFAIALPNLKRSLELQPIQLGTWFNAGYCAWKLEDYPEAIRCYHRCVCLEPEHFEAWNNLSAAYIRVGQREKAWKLLQEALKFNYEHAKVWENFMLLSADVGEFAQAVAAYNRLLDLNMKNTDDQILEIVGSEIIWQLKSQESLELKKKAEMVKMELIKLLARIASTHSLSTKLKKPTELTADTTTAYEQYVQLLEKSLNAAMNQQNWARDEVKCLDVLECAVRLANERLTLAANNLATNAARDANSRIRLQTRMVLGRVEQAAQGRTETDVHARLLSAIEEAQNLVNLATTA